MSSIARSERDPRLDFFRGLALITIFVNHVPGNLFEGYTSRNFGFSDAAEAFVLMSGMAAGLAYTNTFVRSWALATLQLLRRVGKLYVVQISISLLAIAVLTWFHVHYDTGKLSSRVNLQAIFDMPAAGSLGVLVLSHQLGYFNILPLYMVLLAATPLLLWGILRDRRVVLFCSVVIWAASGYFGINAPNYPTQGGWFLNPFSWQLIFVIGLLVGTSIKRGIPFVSFHPAVFVAACAYIVFAASIVVSQRFDYVSFNDYPSVFAGFDKSILPVFRLTHILSLAYVAGFCPIFLWVAQSRLAGPVIALGKESLAVFAWGSVISITLQCFKEVWVFNTWMDTLVLLLGLIVQYRVAVYCRNKRSYVRNLGPKVQLA